ncbi:MAG: glycine cleavage system aminomethyltransferase GcvT [Candidatus Omnitrophota bacterium]|jgi:aminomethyltransferase
MISDHTRVLPLHEKHAKLQAKFGAFGEWEVPLYYTSILEEHEAVRSRAGLFDISHMGGFWIEGPGAVSFLEELLPRRVAPVEPGRAVYSPLLNEHGGFVDDIVFYRFSQERFYLIVNASNVRKDAEWITSRLTGGVGFSNETGKKGLLSLQGPASPRILGRVCGKDFLELKYYRFKPFNDGMIAKTGYTGEEGFEILVDVEDLPKIWDDLFDAGKSEGLTAAGFGARDTLRFEAGMLLYGHDMDDRTTPLEAGVGWAVDLSKGSFVGREALLRQNRDGVPRRFVGLEMIERGIPRQGCEILKNGVPAGQVTSGSFSPTFRKNLGLGYVADEWSAPGTEVEIMIRQNPVKARVAPLPFYRRKK